MSGQKGYSYLSLDMLNNSLSQSLLNSFVEWVSLRTYTLFWNIYGIVSSAISSTLLLNNTERPQVTNIRNRTDNILVEIAIIREGLAKSSRYPPCCLTVNKNGEISCDILGPLPEKDFLEQCMKCRVEIKRFLAIFNLEKKQK